MLSALRTVWSNEQGSNSHSSPQLQGPTFRRCHPLRLIVSKVSSESTTEAHAIATIAQPRIRCTELSEPSAMRVTTILSALLAGTVALADTVPVFIQPISASEAAPALLIEISHDIPEATTDPTQPPQISTEILSYEAPELPEDAKLVRIGAYDNKAARWTSSTTVMSVENFGKGYSPHFVLTLDANGKDLIGVACRGVRVDAGYTRDFGPQVKVVVTGRGKQPELNKPVVLSPEGKKVVPEEKTWLQKYWWVLAIGMFLAMSGGGGDGK
ncbi:hypothetical protein QBC34DRAFT_391287 [Podospora aff. communis PSN243]|uniref:Cyclin-dependent protein kinase regulator pho80 n=1 Tax=Podospora aff. communis PSN243 TaxID=3040156 RepID=A0AAV9H2X7_9PEZI|nr:hypothetical protein QBC34DRAFT_391287 [Podospora aff. communis PSN243]